MIFILLLLLLLLNSAPSYATPPQYDIVASYFEGEHRIYGSEKIAFVNDGQKPLSELYLFLYPNLYLEKDSEIDPSFYTRAYPTQFNPGEQIITSVQDMGGKPLPYFPDVFKKRILMKIHLPTPIPPQATFHFLVHFVTVIPEKWGVFGYYRNVATLQGGWHPYLPRFEDGKWNFLLSPPKSRFRVYFTLREDFQLIASVPLQVENSGGGGRTYFLKADDLPYVSLSIGEKLIREERKIDGVEIVYHALRRDRRYAGEVLKAASEAASFFLEQESPPAPIQLQLAEAYLYQDLTGAGGKLLYMNTRLFKVFPSLKRFHEASIAQGVFLLLWRETLPNEEEWVTEGLARFDAERFMRQKYGNRSNLEQWLKPFSFIPVIDEILYSKDLPLRQIYFKETVAPILNEDVQVFNHPRPEGGAIFSKLRSLLGEALLQRAVSAYRRQIRTGERPSFRETLFQVSGRDLDWFFEQWLMANPSLDFGIERIDYRKIDGAYQTSIVVKKEGEGVEPLEILAYEKNGSQIPLVWNGKGERHEEVLVTPSPIDVVEIDPRRNSSDPNRLDNRSPHLWKVLLNRYGVSYDFQTHVISYKAGFLFQPIYDNRNRIRVDFNHSDEGNAAHIDYTKILLNNHSISVGGTHKKPETTENTFPEEAAGYLHLGYSLNYPDIPLFAEYIQKLTGKYPTFNISLNYNQRFTGGEYSNSFLLGLDLRRFYSFSNQHEIGGRLFIGQSVGTLFQNSRFFLGGDNGMRGYTPLAFEGENMSLFSIEYRFPLFRETDLNLFGLAHTHTWQGALFADTGNVTNAHNVFQFVNYESDFGAGFRFFLDFFGFYPAVVRFDVAAPMASPFDAEQKPHYYLTAGQPF